jgi:hypothetical protein
MYDWNYSDIKDMINSIPALVLTRRMLSRILLWISVAAGLGSTHGFPGWVGLMGRVGSKS